MRTIDRMVIECADCGRPGTHTIPAEPYFQCDECGEPTDMLFRQLSSGLDCICESCCDKFNSEMSE